MDSEAVANCDIDRGLKGPAQLIARMKIYIFSPAQKKMNATF